MITRHGRDEIGSAVVELAKSELEDGAKTVQGGCYVEIITDRGVAEK